LALGRGRPRLRGRPRALLGAVAPDETLSFILRRYWSGRSALQIVFDPRGWDFYQARELSYALDFLDAQWVRLLLSRDILFLVPPSSMLASLAVVAIGLRLAPRALPSLDRATRWLVLLVFLSNFVFLSTMGWLYRATKPLVAPLLLGLLLFVVAEHRRPRLGPRATFTAVFATALAMSLLTGGLFYVLALGRSLLPLPAGAVALGVFMAAVGPPTTSPRAVGHPRPQRLLAEFRFSACDRTCCSRPGSRPWTSLGDWTSVLFGGFPPLALAAAAAAAGAAWVWRNRRRRGWLGFGFVVGAAVMAGQVVMVALMVQRYDFVTWVDHRFWYYPLPYQTLVSFGLLWALDHGGPRAEANPTVGTPCGRATRQPGSPGSPSARSSSRTWCSGRRSARSCSRSRRSRRSSAARSFSRARSRAPTPIRPWPETTGASTSSASTASRGSPSARSPR
jgi:hypothetical protein